MIDFHTHVFPQQIAARTAKALAESGNIVSWIHPTEQELLRSMDQAGIEASVTLPVCTRADKVHSMNERLVRQAEETTESRLIRFGVMHPDTADMNRELRFLSEHGVKGFKLHPAFQQCVLDDPRMLRIIDAASEEGLIVVCHGGMDVSYPGMNWASVPMILRVLREVSPSRLVMAHMGAWGCWKEVACDLAGAPLWFDTSFSLGQVTALHPAQDETDERKGLTAETFVRLIRAHGVQKILFGTDSPWDDQSKAVRRIQQLSLTAEEKTRILTENAAELLQLDMKKLRHC